MFKDMVNKLNFLAVNVVPFVSKHIHPKYIFLVNPYLMVRYISVHYRNTKANC